MSHILQVDNLKVLQSGERFARFKGRLGGGGGSRCFSGGGRGGEGPL